MPKKTSKNKSLDRQFSFSVKQLLMFAVVFGIVGVVVIAQSLAAPRSRNKLTIPDGTYGGTTVAALSGTLPDDPWVVAECYQNSSPVIFNRIALDTSGQAVLTLGPTGGWQSGMGGADCKAEAKNWNAKRQKWESLTTTTFHVSD